MWTVAREAPAQSRWHSRQPRVFTLSLELLMAVFQLRSYPVAVFKGRGKFILLI